jgi:hypothetical protein
VGCWLQDADSIQTQYFPGITILSADYEEQHVLLLSFSIAMADPDILLGVLWLTSGVVVENGLVWFALLPSSAR